MTPEQEAHVDEFINDCFRNTADADYISARASYRLGLVDQFLWLGTQAIEKYLKGILLLYGKDTRGIQHNLTTALTQVKTIPDVPWDFPNGLHEFLTHLTTYGNNRYFSIPRARKGHELVQMDNVVWSVRRYCQRLFYTHGWRSKEPGRTIIEEYVATLTGNEYKESPHKFRLLVNGYLEEVLLTDKHTAQREQLVWKNLYYGRRRKSSVQDRRTIAFSLPAHLMHPDIYPWLSSKVKFPKEVKEHFEEDRTNNNDIQGDKE